MANTTTTTGKATKGKGTKGKGTKAPAPAPAPATLQMPAPVAPANRKGQSTHPHPVAHTWVTCYNMVASAPNGTVPTRKAMHVAVMGAQCPTTGNYTVAYYTARTQVQKFRQWLANGANPAQLPKGVVIG
jgi:hypothetical protein